MKSTPSPSEPGARPDGDSAIEDESGAAVDERGPDPASGQENEAGNLVWLLYALVALLLTAAAVSLLN